MLLGKRREIYSRSLFASMTLEINETDFENDQRFAGEHY